MNYFLNKISIIIDSFFKIFNIILYKNDTNYRYLLEHPKEYSFGDERISDISLNNILVQTIKIFMEDNNLYENGVLVSLSGGVDSMVLISILFRLQIDRHFNIYTSTINYNLRKESLDEVDFIKKYCSLYDHVYYNVTNVEGTFADNNKRCLISGNKKSKRSEFEDELKNIRYNSYNEIISNFNCKGVMLGHHEDDIIENIFTNSMRGHNILDIEVMKHISNISNENRNCVIYRPLLSYRKSEILKFAELYKIPYFLDTTPKWSRRGKMRNEIFPLFTDVFSSSWKTKFKEIGTQSNNWCKTINTLIINPWIEKVKFGKYGFVLPIQYTDDINIWTYAIPKMFFKINYNTIKHRTITKLLEIINNFKNQKTNIITLDSGFNALIINNDLVVFHLEDIKNESKDFNIKDFNIKNFNEILFYLQS
jgi:tRNA(Ile)-lysidine synthetase-like protein